jgi:dihydropyrimidine dehydrogenase (NAD+) subunit PreT
VNALRANGETREGVEDAVEFISDLRQAGDLGALPVGRNVVVIGGGMTAIDAAVQSKLLGAESVTILYRRGREAMPASRFEQDLAASKGVRFVFNAMPVEILGNGAVTGVRVEYTKSEGHRSPARARPSRSPPTRSSRPSARRWKARRRSWSLRAARSR